MLSLHVVFHMPVCARVLVRPRAELWQIPAHMSRWQVSCRVGPKCRRPALLSQIVPTRTGDRLVLHVRVRTPRLLALTWCFHKKLDMVRFMAACDCFAIAYEAVGALKYASAMAHERNLLQIACRAGLEKRRHYLCQFYDEVSRLFLCKSE